MIGWIFLWIVTIALLVYLGFRWWDRELWQTRNEDEPTRPKVISEQELKARFLDAPGSRLFEAVLAVCDDEAQEQLEECLDEALSNEQLRYRVGAVAGIQQVKERLMEYEREARKVESETEKEEEEGKEDE